jgi:hypothetical protein
MSIHTIRLAGPWELWAEGSDPVRVQLPSDVPSNGQLVRKFHRPDGLGDDSEVRVELTVNHGRVVVSINDHLLPATSESPPHFDITPFLQSFNSLCIQSTAGGTLVLQAAVIQIFEAE